MDLATYTLSQRLLMFLLLGVGAWIVPAVISLPPRVRARVDLSEYTVAYGASRSFGIDFEDAPARVFRAVLLIVGVLIAVPELLGLL